MCPGSGSCSQGEMRVFFSVSYCFIAQLWSTGAKRQFSYLILILIVFLFGFYFFVHPLWTLLTNGLGSKCCIEWCGNGGVEQIFGHFCRMTAANLDCSWNLEKSWKFQLCSMSHCFSLLRISIVFGNFKQKLKLSKQEKPLNRSRFSSFQFWTVPWKRINFWTTSTKIQHFLWKCCLFWYSPSVYATML